MLTDDHKQRELLWDALWLDAHSSARSGKQDKRENVLAWHVEYGDALESLENDVSFQVLKDKVVTLPKSHKLQDKVFLTTKIIL